ncbi:MAG: hypothetical protein ACLR6J_14785 [Parabacteroides merdae]
MIKLNPKLKEGVKAGMTIKIPVQAEENMTTEPATTMLSERDVNALLSEPGKHRARQQRQSSLVIAVYDK